MEPLVRVSTACAQKNPVREKFHSDRSVLSCLFQQVGLLFLKLSIPTAVVVTTGQALAAPIDYASSSRVKQANTVQYLAQVLPDSESTAYYSYDSRILSTGSRGEAVRQVQQQLNNLGYNVDVDGVYGAQTEEAVRRFQQSQGLFVDGVAGEDTQQALGIGQAGNSGSDPIPYPPSSSTSSGRLAYCSNQQNSTAKRYVVLIPSANIDRLAQVKRYTSFRDAFIARSPLGTYIQAGACTDSGIANSRTQFLRRQGFKDAQVRYF